MSNIFSVKDKVVVITGGTGVLGSCIGKYLASEGAKVVILGRRKEEGDAIVKEIKDNGGEAMFLVTDVMDKDVVERNCADILAAYGKVDSLLNAAGGNMPGATIPPSGTFFDVNVSECEPYRNRNTDAGVSQTYGQGGERNDCQLLLDGCFPTADQSDGLRGSESGNLKFHGVYG